MIESKANGYFYYLPQTNVQYPQVFHTYPFTYSGLQNLPEVKVQPKLVQPTQPEKKHTIVVDSNSGVVVSCIDGTCNYAKENIIPSTALLCIFEFIILLSTCIYGWLYRPIFSPFGYGRVPELFRMTNI